MTTDPGDLVRDPTCGSGTTASVAEQWGRRWITLDTSRVALALARTRLMAARFPYYLLADSPEVIRKEADLTGQTPPMYQTSGDIRKGFVYKRVPHITLKAIANNAGIDVIHERWQPDLNRLRAELNGLLGKTWEEWEVPRPSDEHWSDQVRSVHIQWWDQRRQRQQQIDDSIARAADTELLYDQPSEKLQRALRAEMDEAAWQALYSTVSRPFDPPSMGRIAVKVINHLGDEVLKVYDVRKA